MDLSMLAMAILPIVLFVFVEMKYGLKAGILTSIITIFILAIWFYLKSGTLDQLLIVEAGLLTALGLVSLKLKDSKYFKMQPFIVGMILSSYIGYLQLFSEPILIRYLPMMVSLNPNLSAVMENPLMLEKFAVMSGRLYWLILIHSFFVLYAALKWNSGRWLAARLSVYPALIILALIP